MIIVGSVDNEVFRSLTTEGHCWLVAPDLFTFLVGTEGNELGAQVRLVELERVAELFEDCGQVWLI